MTTPGAAHRQLRFAAPPGATQILLVRHGESVPAVEGKPFPLVDGQGDPALSEEGHRQATRLAARLATVTLDAIYVTTLRRTAQTAAPVAEALGLTPRVEPELREVHLGEWEGGLFRKHVAEGHPVALRMHEEQRYDVIPGAEPTARFSRRVGEAIRRIAAAHPGEQVVVVSHGGVIGEILAQAAASRPFAFTGCDNASISELVVAQERWIVRRFNDTAHLEERG